MESYITFQNVVVFGVGMAVVYMMARFMGVVIVVLCLALTLTSNAQTPVSISNWPYDQSTFTNSLPVTIVEDNAPDRWPAFASGMGCGFMCFLFAMKIRMAKKTVIDF